MRELTGETKPATLLLMGVLLFGGAHVILFALTRNLRGILAPPFPPEAGLLAAAVILVLLPFGVSAGINHAVTALFDRGDLDLLASSPIGSRTVFASRVVAVAAGVFVGLGLFLVPVASTGVLIGAPQLLGAIPTLVSLSITSACLGMLITLLLVRLLGARRARTFSQVLAALTGLFLVLATQLPNLLGMRSFSGEALAPLLAYFAPGQPLAADGWIWLPFRSLYFHPLGTLVSLLLAALLLYATVLVLHRSFAYGIGAADASTGSRRRKRAKTQVRFATADTLRSLLRKEWKLIRRDPYLISQVLLQSAYMLPALFVLLIGNRGDVGGFDLIPGAATALTVLGGVTASSLARIVVVGEESPDLLSASPVGALRVESAKRLAALLPVLAIVVPVSLWILVVSPLPGVSALVVGSATALAVVQMRLWNPAAASRKDLFKRQRLGDPVVATLESFLPLVTGVAAYLVAIGSWWATLPLALAGAFLAIANARH